MPNLFSSLQTFISRYLRPRQMDRSRFLPSLLGKSDDAEGCPVQRFHAQYLNALGNAYNDTPGPDLPPLARCRICRVALMKKPSSAQHEYDLFFVSLDGAPWEDESRRVGKLVCERAGVVPEDASSSESTGQILPETVQSTLGTARRALDQYIVYTPDGEVGDKDDAVYVHDFDAASAPTLIFLFAVGEVIHRDSQHYLVSTRQCYYFAMLLYRAMISQRAAELQANLPMRDENLVINGYATDQDASTQYSDRAGIYQSWFQLVSGTDIEDHHARLETSISMAYSVWEAKVQAKERPWRAKQEEVSRMRDTVAAKQKEASRMRDTVAAKDEEISRLREMVAALQVSNAGSTAEP